MNKIVREHYPVEKLPRICGLRSVQRHLCA